MGGRTILASLVVVAIVAFSALEGRHWLEIRRYDAGTTPVCRVETTERIVALSFDDGPDPALTPGVVDLLDREDVVATFFLIGTRAERSPELVSAELEEGSEIASHTWSHAALSDLSDAEARAEIERGIAAIGVGPRSQVALFRPPFGVIDATTARTATRALDLTIVGWSVPLDHVVADASVSPDEAARRIVGDIRPGDIILAHDATLGSDAGAAERRRAFATLTRLIPSLRARGYTITTVGRLLSAGEPVRATPRPWFWQHGFGCPRG